MKQIKYEKTPVFKTYDDASRIARLKELVDADNQHYSKSSQYKAFYDYTHMNPTFPSQVHYIRYMNTAGVLFNSLSTIEDQVIIETGGASPLSGFLSVNNQCFTTESDLRKKVDAPDSFADLVICCEVFEHIKDHEPTNLNELTSFQASGAKKFISELYRAIKPGGHLLLTTPNSSSYRAILNAVQHKPSYIFRGHVREYTKDELLSLFSSFELVHYETQNNFSLLLDDGLKVIEKKFNKLKWSTKDRGDNHIFILKKPA